MENFEFAGSMHEPVCKGGGSNGQVNGSCRIVEIFSIIRLLWDNYPREELGL